MAGDAGSLRLVHGFETGLRRLKLQTGFAYLDAAGSTVDDPAVLERIDGSGDPAGLG